MGGDGVVLGQWWVEHADAVEAPLVFDNNDYDRVYDSIVTKDHLYAKVLADDARLLEKLRSDDPQRALSTLEIDELLVLRDLLVSRFGIGKSVG